jgi:hypothetical protein
MVLAQSGTGFIVVEVFKTQTISQCCCRNQNTSLTEFSDVTRLLSKMVNWPTYYVLRSGYKDQLRNGTEEGKI